ncbi:hypothetical protein EDEG_02308 [Edhazardia aedis USNM 41457]|uniref:Uncharacterized protein n=1 Tax=Edhazardia aedis (strain USNM 41457) TaxID=1003232 RepID=J9D6C6_EDHAE|nr:hypothetical protein EDEG_02308 [Edhazardia aedis USNM 41457]|eukprot:EJW03351.1 hypothetical protein EDEG_02308 [Edhazardia aedis USNM 41457]
MKREEKISKCIKIWLMRIKNNKMQIFHVLIQIPLIISIFKIQTENFDIESARRFKQIEVNENNVFSIQKIIENAYLEYTQSWTQLFRSGICLLLDPSSDYAYFINHRRIYDDLHNTAMVVVLKDNTFSAQFINIDAIDQFLNENTFLNMFLCIHPCLVKFHRYLKQNGYNSWFYDILSNNREFLKKKDIFIQLEDAIIHSLNDNKIDSCKIMDDFQYENSDNALLEIIKFKIFDFDDYYYISKPKNVLWLQKNKEYANFYDETYKIAKKYFTNIFNISKLQWCTDLTNAFLLLLKKFNILCEDISVKEYPELPSKLFPFVSNNFHGPIWKITEICTVGIDFKNVLYDENLASFFNINKLQKYAEHIGSIYLSHLL